MNKNWIHFVNLLGSLAGLTQFVFSGNFNNFNFKFMQDYIGLIIFGVGMLIFGIMQIVASFKALNTKLEASEKKFELAKDELTEELAEVLTDILENPTEAKNKYIKDKSGKIKLA